MLAARSLSKYKKIQDTNRMEYWLGITVNFDDSATPTVSREDLAWATNLLDNKVLWVAFKRDPESRMAKYVALKLGRRIFHDSIISIKVYVQGESFKGEFVLQREAIDVLQPEEQNGTTA